MTANEIAKLLYVIRAAYPNTFGKYNRDQIEGMTNVWTMVLSDYSYDQAAAGVKAYIASDSKGFPPVPGQIIDKIQKAKDSGEMSAGEAWALVRKAARNSSYNAEEEYTKLPDQVQKVLGGAINLQAMGMMDAEQMSVQQALFCKRYDIEMERRRELQKIPKDVIQLLLNNESKIGELTDASNY